VAPTFSYTLGGTLLTVLYEVAYSPASPRAACLFNYLSPDGGEAQTIPSPFIAVDEEASAVQCFAPRADLLAPELAASGGFVTLQLTTNGRDPSANSWPFLYRRSPEITRAEPEWLLARQGRTVAVVGSNFFSPAEGSEFTLTSLADPSRAVTAEVVYVDEEHLEFEWPAYVFAIGEQVGLRLSLDGGSVY